MLAATATAAAAAAAALMRLFALFSWRCHRTPGDMSGLKITHRVKEEMYESSSDLWGNAGTYSALI